MCTGNVDRSPAAEAVLAAIGNGAHETRSAGTSQTAPRPLGEADLDWADVVAVMEEGHRDVIALRWSAHIDKVRVLGIPDRFQRDDPALRVVLESRLRDVLAAHGGMIGR